MHIRDIPEIQGLDARRALIRIPPEIDVPLTPRVRQIIDTAEFRRLARVSQLGLVSFVYPAAHHTRFEHSLGVYRMALLYLKQLSQDERFTASIEPADAEVFLVAGSSLAVRPAGALPEKALLAGARLIIVNDSPTRLDRRAHAVLRGKTGDILPALAEAALG